MASIRKRGSRWQAQVRRAGRKPISKTFIRKSHAAAWASQMELALEASDVGQHRVALSQLTLAELIERYRRETLPLKRAPEREDIMLHAFLRQPLARKSLDTLIQQDFASYRDMRLKSVKAATVCRELGLIQHCLKIARDDWGIPLPANPLEKLRRPSLPPGRKRRLSTDEERRLMAAARKCRNSLIAPLIVLALETGMRRGELLSIRPGHIDHEKRLLYLPETKNGEARYVPLSTQALSALDSIAARGDDWPLSCLTGSAVQQSWKRLTRRAGLIDLHFHDLRHEAISRMIEKGLTIPEAAMVSGHRDPRMLLRYTHPHHDHVCRKLNG